MPSPERSETDFLFEAMVATLRNAALATIANEIRGQYEPKQEVPPEIAALLRKLGEPTIIRTRSPTITRG
jgi:hypothetical protein